MKNEVVNIYFERIKNLWESLGYKDATKFARELGSNRGEKILRLTRKDTFEPSIELIGDILRRFSKVDPLWLIAGENKMFIDEESSKVVYKENDSLRKVEEDHCFKCEVLQAKLDGAIALIESQKQTIAALKGESKKEITSYRSAQGE